MPQDRWSVLLIFQGMDAAGKDSAIEHVMRGINPQGCEVHAVQGADLERNSTTIFCGAARCGCRERGRIGIFNRSYYEEVSWCACIRNSGKQSCRRSS